LDHETKQDISAATEQRLLAVLEEQIESLDAIILEDYNKGVITRGVIAGTIALALEHRKPILVDPKLQNFFEYKNATVFKPNRKEVEDALGVRLETTLDVEAAGRELLSRLKAENVLLTLGEKGMMLFEKNGNGTIAIPTRARQVADVSGAGDTVIATLAVAMSCGAAVREAAVLANRAAGLVIEELGIVPIYRDQLRDAVIEDIQSVSA
jgi:rfaE bifunctional protein kinase chain/domain